MSQYKNQFEIEPDLSSEIELQNFKHEIHLTQKKMQELIYHDQQYTAKIHSLIRQSIGKIQIEEYQYALVYLAEAQKLLQYGASCGKIIDRQLIICTLHNEACCYQKLSDQVRASKYIQAIIFNLKANINSLESTPAASKLLQTNFIKQSADKNNILYGRKLELAQYYLTFCSVNSQLGKRKESLEVTIKAIQIYKNYFQELKTFLFASSSKNHNQVLCLGEDKQRLTASLKQLKLFRNQSQFELDNVEKYIKIAKYTIKGWSNKLKNTQKQGQTILGKMLSQYSIGNLVEMTVQQYQKKQNQFDVFSQGKTIIKSMAHYCMAYFQIATEYRLIAEEKYEVNKLEKTTSEEYKKAQIYYLLSIIFIALYIPYDFLFMKQIISSFEHHFKINLQKNTEMNQNTIDFSLLFQPHLVSTVLKIRKRSITSNKLKSNSKKSLKFISPKAKNINPIGDKAEKTKKHKLIKTQIPSAEQEYFMHNINQTRKQRVVSNASHKSHKSTGKKSETKKTVIQRIEVHKRIQSCSKMPRRYTITSQPAKQEQNINQYGNYHMDYRKTMANDHQIQQHNKSRKQSVDHFPYNPQQQKQRGHIKSHKKSHSNLKNPLKKQNLKKNEKSKDSKQSVRSSEKSLQKHPKKIDKKTRARQQTITNYYL